MKVYLVWEQVDYSDYGVIKIFNTKEKAEHFIKTLDNEWDHTYSIEEKEVE